MSEHNKIVCDMMDYEAGEMNTEQTAAFFQRLIDSGTIHSLQGSYQRVARSLIGAGLCHVRKETE